MSISGGCNVPGCKVSSTIAGQVSFGWGQLDSDGFWEHPCWLCAQAWRRQYPKLDIWPVSRRHAEELETLKQRHVGLQNMEQTSTTT